MHKYRSSYEISARCAKCGSEVDIVTKQEYDEEMKNNTEARYKVGDIVEVKTHSRWRVARVERVQPSGIETDHADCRYPRWNHVRPLQDLPEKGKVVTVAPPPKKVEVPILTVSFEGRAYKEGKIEGTSIHSMIKERDRLSKIITNYRRFAKKYGWNMP
jgi:hypothetical protein